jgi:putative ABC transport system ATP-binding protein
MVVLDVVQISKQYISGKTKTSALNQVTFSIEQKTNTVITGPSGSGKSTLLNILSMIDTPDEGSVSLFGERVPYESEHKKAVLRRNRIGIVFQNFHLIPVMNVLENVEYPLMRQGVTLHETKKRALEVLSFLGIEEIAAKRVQELSGGQSQRVAIARAIIHKPQVLFADEPTANLDSVNARLIMEQLENLKNLWGTTLVIATHDEFIASQADYRISLLDGRIV